MDFQTLFIIATTTVIHFIGIGLFVVWLAIGKPMSVPEWKRWWKKGHFLPGWHERQVKGIAPEQNKVEVVSDVH